MMGDPAAVGTLLRTALIAAAMLAAAAGCGQKTSTVAEPVSDGGAAPDGLEMELRALDTAAWVRAFDPARSAGGFNMVLYRRRLPMIIDMNGRIVHSWPGVRASGRARLDDSGRLSVISVDNAIEEYDWSGRRTWDYRLPDAGHLLHHDFIWLRNGNLMVLANDPAADGDYLLEVDRDRREVWRWRFSDHRHAFPNWDDERSDPTHANSVFELAANRWFEGGDERFRPGNLLVSARNLNTVLVIDRESREVVWTFSRGLDNQHEATMIAPGEAGGGTVLVFDNGLENLHRYRRSRVLAVDPVSRAVTWRYRSRRFYSAVGGTAQGLPGGNVQIASSRGGRVMEVTRDHRVVWEWVPPYLPMRPLRVAADHCPQLAAVRPAELVPVSPPSNLPYVDIGLYRFGLPQEVFSAEIAGRSTEALAVTSGCRVLLIPPGATLDVGFGIRPPSGPGSPPVAGRFRLELRRGEGPETLVDVEVAAADEAWVEMPTFDLAELAYSRLRMCLDAEVIAGPDDAADRLLWSQPEIESRVLRAAEPLQARTPGEREQAFLRRQLEALGYVE